MYNISTVVKLFISRTPEDKIKGLVYKENYLRYIHFYIKINKAK